VSGQAGEIIRCPSWVMRPEFTASNWGKPELYRPRVGAYAYGPGSYIRIPFYANVGRNLTGEAVFREAEILCDIAGGIPATLSL